MKDKINILFIGDIIGEPGFRFLKLVLPSIKTKYNIDFTIANVENITNGVGILEKDAENVLALGVDVMTGGNHTFDKIQAHKYINESEKLLRPLNYPKGVYGKGYGIFKINDSDINICVSNFQGRVYMRPIEDPFRTFDWMYEKVKEQTNIIVVDFHAEVTAEKIAFGWHADGRASVVFGTHTHVQTADSRVLPGGTAYITDVGMTGPYDSVIGMKKEVSLRRFIYATPQKHEVASDDIRLAACVSQIDIKTGKALSITRIMYPEF